MSIEQTMNISDGNAVELHYWFEDNSHLMDALVQNKCEYEFLGIVNQIASTFKVQITIETEPLADGGLRRWFKIATKEEGKKATITIAIIIAILTGVFVTPITASISKAAEILIEKIFEDHELKELEKEKLKLEIMKLKQEIKANTRLLDANNVVKRKKSNFYEALEKYSKVDKVTFKMTVESGRGALAERTISRRDFKQFILVTDDLDPIEVENAVIEIISPVLKRGNYKWTGLYNGDTISFSMKSNEFKGLIQTGEVKFKNGTSINCFLIIRRRIDNEGLEKVSRVEVIRVNYYFENDKPIETQEGRRHRRGKENENIQLNIFPQDECDGEKKVNE